MRRGLIMVTAIAGATLLAASGVKAAGPGAGKITSSIIKLPSTPFAKAAGKMTVGPKDFKAGGAPQGSIYKFKFTADSGNPLKPGFAPGRYIIQINTNAAPSPGTPPSVAAFMTFTIGADNKCTIDPSASVIPPDGGFPGPGGCGEMGEPLCDGPHVAKCEFTQYQAAGSFLYGVVIDALPLQFVVRIRSLAPAHDTGGGEDDCLSGFLDLTGDDDTTNPCIGGAAPNPTPNPVVAIVGIAAGADDNP